MNSFLDIPFKDMALTKQVSLIIPQPFGILSIFKHVILNKKKYLGACLYLAPVRIYCMASNDKKKKKAS